MRKQIIGFLAAAAFLACPLAASAYEFGVIDSSKVFKEYKQTIATKKALESQKDSLQNKLKVKQEEVKKLNEEYMTAAKKLQELRERKKEKEAKQQEGRIIELRKELNQKTGELQRFFEESQKDLYKLEEEKMGALADDIEKKVEKAVESIAKKNRLKAVIAKNTTFYTDPKQIFDITDEVIKTLNK